MSASVLVAENLRFDHRLALFHETEHWLAVADLHYGYELSQRAAGALIPAWGMSKIEQRLADLVADYRPKTVLFLGDLVHTAAASASFRDWLGRIIPLIPNLVLLRGNHDRHLRDLPSDLPLHDQRRIGSHLFHHGDRPIDPTDIEPGDIVFSGHLHPAETLRDGAGLRQKLPVLLQTPSGYILPAFSPWAAGGKTSAQPVLRTWIATSRRVYPVG